jgi:hypothetical protein
MRIVVNVCVPQSTHDRGYAVSREQAMVAASYQRAANQMEQPQDFAAQPRISYG